MNKRGLSARLVVMLTPGQLADLEEEARERLTTVSGVARERMFGEARPPLILQGAGKGGNSK